MNHDHYARYRAACAYLENVSSSDLSYVKGTLTSHPNPEIFLDRMQDFLDRIGNPEKGFKYVHITGTSGKGSVSCMVQATIAAHGKRTGLFTSPFVVTTVEKIQVGGKYIDAESFTDIVETLKPHLDRAILEGKYGMPSYFELILAVALLYFKQEKCEYVVLEVGLGGRYDATNIIKAPLVTAITNISLDHMQVLGSTHELIASDKAGIIKKRSTFFTTEERSDLRNIFKAECDRMGASYNPLPVRGLDYAARNQLLAGMICKHIGIIDRVDEVEIKHLPARFEIMQKKPLVIIDGAHNPAKIQSTIYNLEHTAYKRLILVIAVSSDKDWRSIMNKLSPLASRIYITRFTMPKRQPANLRDLAREAKKHSSRSTKIFVRTDPFQAFTEAKKAANEGDAVLVTGSFFLAGDIRALYHSEEEILKRRSSL